VEDLRNPMNICLITLTFATTVVAQLLPQGTPYPIEPNAVVANVATEHAPKRLRPPNHRREHRPRSAAAGERI
jgi:hypothetical protein